MKNAIRIRGARTHNLRNLDVDIPRNQFVVITGVSGSGKSSLAFDTLLAEGQRQYIESLSIYSRQFFDQLERPDVDQIEGLQPTIAIDQQSATKSGRSTVATITEIYDYLRLLMARLGQVMCPDCGLPISQQTARQIEQEIGNLPEKTRLMLLAPMARGQKGSHADVFEKIRKAGFVRARIDGTIYPLEEVPSLDASQAGKPDLHAIEAVVDRIVLRPGIESRLGESIRLALKLGEGTILSLAQSPEPSAQNRTDWQERWFNTRYACPSCKTSLLEVEPRTFSFNSPYGACPACSGTGRTEPNANHDANQEPIEDRPWRTAGREKKCQACNGTRLRPEARACQLAGQAIYEITAQPVTTAIRFFEQLPLTFNAEQQPIGEPIVREIKRRLDFLENVGVGYLSLDRPAKTLSGGEMQRVRLATGIGSGLVGVLYLLDEPSIGLHPRDNGRLIAALRDLESQGNSVVVVEHDEAVMRAADHLLDIGPGAGSLGGQIVSQGTPEEVSQDTNSLTGDYLSGRRSIAIPTSRRPQQKSRAIRIEGASAHNLQHVNVEIPLDNFVCVTGVSGSGKSSLVIETLGKALAQKLHRAQDEPGPCDGLHGTNLLERLVEVDQAPIGRSPRSSPATYTGTFDEIRKIFAGTKQARARGYRVGRFSPNNKAGRCDECQGLGVRKIEMNFLPDMEVSCSVCHGARFNRQTLAIRYREKSIADVLSMTVDEGARFFENHAAIHRLLTMLSDV